MCPRPGRCRPSRNRPRDAADHSRRRRGTRRRPRRIVARRALELVARILELAYGGGYTDFRVRRYEG
ncbi:hypothetical protein ACFQL0_04420 [Haloplanus litoreus]